MMLTMLNGYKTYIVGCLSVIYAVIGVYLGQFDMNHAAEIVMAALGGMALRHGISGAPSQ